MSELFPHFYNPATIRDDDEAHDMGIAIRQISPHKFLDSGKLSNSMSQDYHQGAFSFSNVFDRSQQQQQQHQQHVAQQIRRDKMRLQGFDPQPLLGIAEEDSGGNTNIPVYENAGMLSEMFNFPSGGGGGPTSATELLESQISQSYRNQRVPPPADWFSHRNMGTDPAAAMQLFLMNPQQQQRSPSPSPSHNPPPNNSTSSTLHMLLPNPSPTTFHGAPTGFGQYGWVQNSGNVENTPTELPGVVEGQGLSLSLSSSLQHLEAANAEELRMGEGAMLFFGQGGGSTQQHQYQFKASNHQLQVGSSYGSVNMLRNSKYAKAAQELLEEFCSVGRGQFKKTKSGRQNTNNNGADDSSSGSKDVPPLSASDRLEHQRRKVKLLSMLDEVDRRYNHYCEQMQMVVNSFDMVMGFGSAVPYTTLAQKAMSRHFRCLKDAIASQLKISCEMLGEKDVGTSGVTKGETPRLRILEQSLRQQRAFNQMGLMEQEAWRPQRGLPERSVNILRAWLFEHFLHPYPSDADKHLLARQTGLSRNQVSNWFINARVRLWKPMVEEMYQQEAKDEPTDDQEPLDHSSNSAQTPTPHHHHQHDPTTSSLITPLPAGIENDPSFPSTMMMHDDEDDTCRNRDADMESTLIRFGANTGDVSLTLGLRHTGNMPEKSSHFREFGGC